MKRAEIIKEIEPLRGTITDIGHVADTIYHERRFQDSKLRFKLWVQADSLRKRIKKHQQYAELRSRKYSL